MPLKEATEKLAPDALLAAARRFTRASIASNKLIASGELSQAEWHLLWLLKNLPLNNLSNRSGVRPSELARRQQVTAGNVAQQLRRLEEKRFVVRSHDATDRRVVLVRLTSRGEKFLESVREDFVKHFQKLIAHLGKQEASHLTRLLLSAAEFMEHMDSPND